MSFKVKDMSKTVNLSLSQFLDLTETKIQKISAAFPEVLPMRDELLRHIR